MLDNTARMIATLGIWLSFAIIMAFGLCRMSFNGDGALPTFLLAVAMLCLSAVVSTGLVWRHSRAESKLPWPVTEQPAV